MKPRPLSAAVARGLNPGPLPLKIDFSAVLFGLNGKPLKTADSTKPPAGQTPEGVDIYPTKDMTLADACVEALMFQTPESARDPGPLKLRCHTLAAKVQKGGKLEIEAGDAEFLQNKIAVAYGPNVVGPAFALLNG